MAPLKSLFVALLLPLVAHAGAPDELDPARLAIRQKEFSSALTALESRARAGNHNAEYLLGALLLTNPAAEPDPVTASRWLHQAADAGHARAAFMLSVLAATAAPADAAGAQRWLDLAAKAGLDEAVQLQKQKRLPLVFLAAEDLTEKEARLAAFWRAARLNDVTSLERLSSDKASASAVDEFGRSILSVAAAADADEAVAWLLKSGADIHARDLSGATALMLAAGAPKGAALKALLPAETDIDSVDKVDKVGNSALIYAIRADDAARVTALLARGAKPNRANADGDLSLDLALRSNNAEVAAALRAAGATATPGAAIVSQTLTDVQRPKGLSDLYAARSDLEIAATRRDPALLKALLSRDAATSPQKSQALLAAVEAGALESTRVLLASGADSAYQNARKRNAMVIAVQAQSVVLVNALLAAGVSANSIGTGGVPVLIESVRNRNDEITTALLAKGAKIDALDDSGWTALMIAARQSDSKTMDLLLAQKANPGMRDNKGRDAVLHAAMVGAESNVAKLLTAGASAKSVDDEGNTLIGVCASRGMAAVLQTLLAAKVDPGQLTSAGTPLMRAAAANQATAMQVLIKSGVKVNQQDPRGDTALTIAVRAGALEATRLLLGSGADASLRNSTRANAKDIAESLRREAIAKLLAAN
jgi:ankyrin repeat protein